MELDEQGNPIIPEDLRNKPRTEWTPEDWDRSGGSGRAGRAIEGDVVTAGLAYGASKAITPIAKILGPAGIIDAGINIATGESDTAFEKKLEAFKPAKVAAKSTRLIYDNILKDVFDHRILDRPSSITRFSTLQKHKHNKDILDQYVWHKAEHGPFKKWEDQGIPKTEVSEGVTESARNIYNRKINPDQMKLFGLPTDPEGIEAFRIFSDNVARKSGYQSMSDFRKNVLNKWPSKDQDQLFRQLWEGQGEGYIEHLTAKGSHMDWYWNMKGKDRNAVNNVRILFNDNLKNLKDTVEKIVYGTPQNPGLGWQGKDLKNRLIVSFEDPMKKVKKDYLKQNPGDIIIKRAGNDQIIGNLGQYLDTLYPQDPLLKKVFEDGVKKLGLTPTQFRKQVLSERIGIIIENSDTLPKNATKRKRYIKQFIDDDMSDLVAQYPFLSPRKSITEAMDAPGSGVTEADYDLRGQGKNPIPPLGDPKFTKGGPFPSKTEMMNIEKAKRKGYVQGDLMNFLQNLFPDE